MRPKDAGDLSKGFESDPTRPAAQLNFRAAVAINTDDGVRLEAPGDLDLPYCEIGSTGVVISAQDLVFRLSDVQPFPEGIDPPLSTSIGLEGAYLGRVQVFNLQHAGRNAAGTARHGEVVHRPRRRDRQGHRRSRPQPRHVGTGLRRPRLPAGVPAEVAELRRAIAGHRLEALILAAVGTGLRQGELLGLRWSDVDLDAGILTVRHALDRRTGELVRPKTERSRRTIHRPLPVTTALNRLRRDQEALRAHARRWDARGFVFTNRTGGPLASRNVTQDLQAILAAAGLPRQRFHDLRHIFATLQLEAGAELLEVSRALGHADIGTTANIYAHWTDAMAARTAERMSGILGA